MKKSFETKVRTGVLRTVAKATARTYHGGTQAMPKVSGKITKMIIKGAVKEGNAKAVSKTVNRKPAVKGEK